MIILWKYIQFYEKIFDEILKAIFYNFVKNIYKDIDKFLKNLGVANENFWSKNLA